MDRYAPTAEGLSNLDVFHDDAIDSTYGTGNSPFTSVGKADQTDHNDDQLSLRLEIVASMLPPPANTRILKKAVQAVHSYPTNGEHTALTRRLFNAVVEIIQEVFRKTSIRDRELVKAARGTPKFSVPTRRLLEMMAMEAGAHYDRVYSAMETLFAWEIKWNLMGDVDNNASKDPGAVDVVLEAVTSRFISQWGKGEGPRSGLVTFEVPHDVLMMVLEPRPYAQLDLRVVNELGSASAIGLYECCARYVGTTHKVTGMLPVDEWIAMIAGPGKYAGGYFDFNRYCLKPAMKQLESAASCPFTVESKIIYGARKKVTGLQFKMHLKQQRSFDVEMPLAWSAKTLEALFTIYGMSRTEVMLLARTASEAEVQEAIARDIVMVAKKQRLGEAIQNRSRYLRGILRNVQGGLERGAEPEEESVEVHTGSGVPGLSAATQRLSLFRKAFDEYKLLRLREEMAFLPESELQHLRTEWEMSVTSTRSIQAMVAKGWNPPHPAVAAIFVKWVMEAHAAMPERMLMRPEDNDLALWMMLNPDADKKSDATTPPATLSKNPPKTTSKRPGIPLGVVGGTTSPQRTEAREAYSGL